MKHKTKPVPPTSLAVTEFKGKPVADSRDVARMIGKRHKNLLRDIDGYVSIIENNAPKIGAVNGLNFEPVDFFISSRYRDAKGEMRPCYKLTKKGCDMVANKLTGEKGVLFTAAYVTAFEEMRERIQEHSSPHWQETRLAGKAVRPDVYCFPVQGM